MLHQKVEKTVKGEYTGLKIGTWWSRLASYMIQRYQQTSIREYHTQTTVLRWTALLTRFLAGFSLRSALTNRILARGTRQTWATEGSYAECGAMSPHPMFSQTYQSVSPACPTSRSVRHISVLLKTNGALFGPLSLVAQTTQGVSNLMNDHYTFSCHVRSLTIHESEDHFASPSTKQPARADSELFRSHLDLLSYLDELTLYRVVLYSAESWSFCPNTTRSAALRRLTVDFGTIFKREPYISYTGFVVDGEDNSTTPTLLSLSDTMAAILAPFLLDCAH